MHSLVGVWHGGTLPSSAKRELLLFDRLAVIEFADMLRFHRESGYGKPDIATEFEWLEEKGLVFQPEPIVWQTTDVVRIEEWRDAWRKANEKQKRAHDLYASLSSSRSEDDLVILTPEQGRQAHEAIRAAMHLNWDGQAYISRAFAVALRKLANLDAISLHDVPEEGTVDRAAKRDDVLRVIITGLPLPNDTTPWESIFDFREESHRTMQALREWVRDVATQGRDVAGIEDNLAYLLEEYRAHMERRRLEYSRGVLETIVTTTAAVAEDLVKLKWKELAEMPFAIRKQRVELLEAEATAPGTQVSYIVRAQNAFGQQS